MSLIGDTLYVADTENHAIRAVDLEKKTVTTVAGTGEIAHAVARTHAPGSARKTALNSPWDLAHIENARILYVAMAGPHQIWRFDAPCWGRSAPGLSAPASRATILDVADRGGQLRPAELAWRPTAPICSSPTLGGLRASGAISLGAWPASTWSTRSSAKGLFELRR